MIKLVDVTVHKYKCIESEQSFSVEPDITILVGMNESGKTSVLEALAKANYFENDDDFIFNTTHDYPRRQKKGMEKTGDVPDAITLTFEISAELKANIESDIGIAVGKNCFTYTKKYDNSGRFSHIGVDVKKFIVAKIKSLQLSEEEFLEKLISIKSVQQFDELLNDNADVSEVLSDLKPYFTNSRGWDNPIEEYIGRVYLKPNMPKFMYYDEYNALPSRVNLETVSKDATTDKAIKTAKALLELAEVDIDNIIEADHFEDFIAELEATQAIISDELFKFWSTNKNLNIRFNIDKQEVKNAQGAITSISHILDIRVENRRTGVSLPLTNRSKGFNWFFSFLVWFKRIQEDGNNTYILLLDEPGLNLHARAQRDLLDFFTELSDGYQIIYTTHSPFMIETADLHKVRMVEETEKGTSISENLDGHNPDTIFPLQAAIGYDMAQNLFVSDKNLIVEGISDLIYLDAMSSILKEKGKQGLDETITIVPVGGADKVSSFVSLFRGNKLKMVCLLDYFKGQKAKANLDNLVKAKLINEKNIIIFSELVVKDNGDLEDMFEVQEYLTLYNAAFSRDLQESDIDNSKPILEEIVRVEEIKRLNHHTPANYFIRNPDTLIFSEDTLARFENMYDRINKSLK